MLNGFVFFHTLYFIVDFVIIRCFYFLQAQVFCSSGTKDLSGSDHCVCVYVHTHAQSCMFMHLCVPVCMLVYVILHKKFRRKNRLKTGIDVMEL